MYNVQGRTVQTGGLNPATPLSDHTLVKVKVIRVSVVFRRYGQICMHCVIVSSTTANHALSNDCKIGMLSENFKKSWLLFLEIKICYKFACCMCLPISGVGYYLNSIYVVLNYLFLYLK